MKTIERLSDKYIVIKRDDLDNYFSQFTRGVFTTDDELKIINNIPFKLVLKEIIKNREAHGKSENHYVVLNMSDEIDLCDLIYRLYRVKHESENDNCHIKNIATDIINAILCAKDACVLAQVR